MSFIFLNFYDKDIVNFYKNLMCLLCSIDILRINILITARDKKLMYLLGKRHIRWIEVIYGAFRMHALFVTRFVVH